MVQWSVQVHSGLLACLLSQIGVLLYSVSFHMLACSLTWLLALDCLPLVFFLCGEFSWLGEKKKGLLLIHKAFFFLLNFF